MKRGLLLIAHGVAADRNNEVFADYLNRIKSNILIKFHSVKLCYSANLHGIERALQSLLNEGVAECFVVPLYLIPTGCRGFSIPGVTEVEGQSGSTMDYRGMRVIPAPAYMKTESFRNSLLKSLKELVLYPREETIILFAHGSNECKPEWDKLLIDTGEFLASNTEAAFFNFTYLQNAAMFRSSGVGLITQELQSSNRLLALGLFFGRSIFDIYQENKSALPKYFENYRREGRLSFSKRSLLAGTYFSSWLNGLTGAIPDKYSIHN